MTHGFANAFALRGAAAALRPAPDGVCPTARPPVDFGGLLADITTELTRAAALDGPRSRPTGVSVCRAAWRRSAWEQGRQVRLVPPKPRVGTPIERVGRRRVAITWRSSIFPTGG